MSSILFAVLLFSSLGSWRAFAQTPTAPASALDGPLSIAADDMQKAQAETQKLRDAWDKTRLEATLYDKRSKRAYDHWVKAAKSLKAKALEAKEKADLELALAIERRKLAWNEWQAAQFHFLEAQSRVQALQQQKDAKDIQAKIEGLESKLGLSSQPTPIATP